MVGRALRRPGLRLGTEEGHPDVTDDTGTLEVGQHMRLAGGDPDVVVVGVGIGGAIGELGGGGGAHAAAFARMIEFGEGVLGEGERSEGEDCGDDDSLIRSHANLVEEVDSR